MGEKIVWLDLKVKRYSAWICQDYLANHVKQKGFLLISLISKAFKFINADFMVHRTQIFMALEIEQTEVGLISQVIQMRRRLNLLQV
jgi:hypothetical protein